MSDRDIKDIGREMLSAGLPHAFVLRVLDLARESEGVADLVHLWVEAPDAGERHAVEVDLQGMIADREFAGKPVTGGEMHAFLRAYAAFLLAQPFRFEVASSHLLLPKFWHELEALGTPPSLVLLLKQAAELDVLYRISDEAGERSRERIVSELQNLVFADDSVIKPRLGRWRRLLRRMFLGRNSMDLIKLPPEVMTLLVQVFDLCAAPSPSGADR